MPSFGCWKHVVTVHEQRSAFQLKECDTKGGTIRHDGGCNAIRWKNHDQTTRIVKNWRVYARRRPWTISHDHATRKRTGSLSALLLGVDRNRLVHYHTFFEPVLRNTCFGCCNVIWVTKVVSSVPIASTLQDVKKEKLVLWSLFLLIKLCTCSLDIFNNFISYTFPIPSHLDSRINISYNPMCGLAFQS